MVYLGKEKPCILEMGLLYLDSAKNTLTLHKFYNTRMCSKIPNGWYKSFKYCQNHIHGIAKPKVNRKRFCKEFPIVKYDNLCGLRTIEYTNLSCYLIKAIIRNLFLANKQKQILIIYKGGTFESRYFKEFLSAKVHIVDLGRFDITGYIDYVRDVGLFGICDSSKHDLLLDMRVWRRHCPQYEVLAFYTYFIVVVSLFIILVTI